MKSIKYIIKLLVVVSLILATSCKKDSENISKITYYPDFKMAGDPIYFIPLGNAFTDSGATATEDGNQIPVTVSVSGDYFQYSGTQVDISSPNKYIITYSAKNKDGFAGSVERDVYIVSTGDLVTSIEGLYTSSITRTPTQGTPGNDVVLTYVMIRKTDANTYELSDAIGGYYDLGRGYGSAYRATGATVTANNIATNDFTYGLSFGVGDFGGSASIVSFKVDAGAKTITFETDWDAGYDFVVTLTQVNI